MGRRGANLKEPKMHERLKEFSDRREWDLAGFRLDQICLDFRTVLLLAHSGDSVTLTIAEPFTLRVGSRTEAIIIMTPSIRTVV
jgi:hypothetical protein